MRAKPSAISSRFSAESFVEEKVVLSSACKVPCDISCGTIGGVVKIATSTSAGTPQR